MKFLRLATWLLLAATSVSASLLAQDAKVAPSTCSEAVVSPQGAWQKTGGDTQVLFTADQIVIRKAGALSVATILRRQPCKLVVRYQGMQSNWELAQDGTTIQLKADETLTLKALPTIPNELDLTSLVLPSPVPVSTAEAQDVEKELVRRGAMDQDALKTPALKAKFPEIKADNLRYLRDLTQRVGWIDIPRFGKRSASAAILIAKHGQDLLLMKAALPIVEKDVKEHGGSGEMFSVLYDELQITLGKKQRYGTQISEDAKGPFIMPIEEPSRVDEYRKEINILSFREYIKLASDNMGGAALRVAGDDE